MNVLIVGMNLDGAMGDNFKFIVDKMHQYKKKNINLFVLSKKKSNFKIVVENQLIVEYKRNILSVFKELYHINKYIIENDINEILILTPNLIYNIFITLKFRRKKILYYLHDPKPHTGESFLRRNLLKFQNKVCSKFASKVIVASEFIKNDIIDNGILGIPEGKLEVIYLGLLENLLFDDIDVSNKKRDILFFGRIEDYKGIDVLVKSIQYLHDNNYHINCTIVGKGNIEKYIEKKDTHLFEINNTYVSDRELAAIIGESKIVVFPYHNATGSQTVQISYYYEANLIASKVGCFNDYVIHGYSGYLFEPGNYIELADKIKSLLEDREQQASFSTNAKKMLNHKFDSVKIINQYYALLEE